MSSIKLFEDKKVRSTWNEQEEKWYFSVIDIIEVLTESTVPKRYWSDLKKKLIKEGSQVYDKIVHLKMIAEDGKNRQTDTADTETILRLIQSIPSPRAEPFKQWLAQVGAERIAEIENPELAQDELTTEWKQRGVKEGKEMEQGGILELRKKNKKCVKNILY